MDDTTKIYFLGFMSSGKTMWAQRLAKKWNWPFIDLDDEIENRAGVSITTLFRDHGEDYFRKLEHHMLVEFSKVKSNFIMATGGGTPCFMDNMQIIQSGISVYLKVRREVLLGRLRREKLRRPLVAHLDDVELKRFIDTTMEEREKFYEKSHVIAEEPGVSLSRLETLVKDQLR